MNFYFTALLLASICFWDQWQSVENVPTSEASLLCMDVHNIPKAFQVTVAGEFMNRNCAVRCSVANVAMPDDLLNEQKPCPDDSTGLCQKGQCIGGVDDARRDCSRKFEIDFNSTNSVGTAYLYNQCTLKCVLNGTVLFNGPKYEGLLCPLDSTGRCHGGVCVIM